MGNGQNNTVHLTNSAPKRFVPTCTICGNQHWPRDPSCAGKKGAKAKAKAKGVLKAKARAKRMGTAAADTSQPAEASGTEMLPASSPAVTFPATPNVSPKPSASTHPATPTGPGTPTFPAKPTVPATPKVSSPPVETSYPGAKTYFAQPAQPAGEPVSPPQQNTVAKPQPQKQPGGETVFKIKAKSKEEITSFTDEIARIKRQADEVVLRTSEDAAHRVQAERTARINAEEKALNEAAARLKAEQKLQAEIDKLKNLQEEARLAVQANQMQMQEIQAQFSDVNTNNDAPAAIRPFEESADATAIPIAPGH
ncbi:MAG: hypothetical protein K9M75_04815, partial [Phycisphaerae bacterium]|nr:hypothetical protein [Phycisphaerae bacterium]